MARISNIGGGSSGSGGSPITNTDALSEGVTNLYFTNERVDDRVAALLVEGANIDFTYNDGANTLTVAAVPSGSDTQVQFNDGGVFGGDAGFTYNKTTDTFTVGAGIFGNANSTIEYTTDHMSINKGANAGVYLFENAVTTERPHLRIYGYADSVGVPAATYGEIYLDAFGSMYLQSAMGQLVANSDLLIFSVGGVGVGKFFADNIPVEFGIDADAKILYNGSDLIINPDAVGGGNVVIDGGFMVADDHFLDDDGTVVFNEQGLDADIRFESNDDSNMFYIDGTANFLGIGTNSPAAKFHVYQTTLGNAVERLASDTSGDDVTETIYQNRVPTTNNTQTTLHTFTIPSSTTYAIYAVVIARRTGGSAGTAEDGARYVLQGVYKNVAGTATIIGSLTGTPADESQAGFDATLTVTGATVLCRVTGTTNNNITWQMTARVWQVSA